MKMRIIVIQGGRLIIALVDGSPGDV